MAQKRKAPQGERISPDAIREFEALLGTPEGRKFLAESLRDRTPEGQRSLVRYLNKRGKQAGPPSWFPPDYPVPHGSEGGEVTETFNPFEASARQKPGPPQGPERPPPPTQGPDPRIPLELSQRSMPPELLSGPPYGPVRASDPGAGGSAYESSFERQKLAQDLRHRATKSPQGPPPPAGAPDPTPPNPASAGKPAFDPSHTEVSLHGPVREHFELDQRIGQRMQEWYAADDDKHDWQAFHQKMEEEIARRGGSQAPPDPSGHGSQGRDLVPPEFRRLQELMKAIPAQHRNLHDPAVLGAAARAQDPEFTNRAVRELLLGVQNETSRLDQEYAVEQQRAMEEQVRDELVAYQHAKDEALELAQELSAAPGMIGAALTDPNTLKAFKAKVRELDNFAHSIRDEDPEMADEIQQSLYEAHGKIDKYEFFLGHAEVDAAAVEKAASEILNDHYGYTGAVGRQFMAGLTADLLAQRGSALDKALTRVFQFTDEYADAQIDARLGEGSADRVPGFAEEYKTELMLATIGTIMEAAKEAGIEEESTGGYLLRTLVGIAGDFTQILGSGHLAGLAVKGTSRAAKIGRAAVVATTEGALGYAGYIDAAAEREIYTEGRRYALEQGLDPHEYVELAIHHEKAMQSTLAGGAATVFMALSPFLRPLQDGAKAFRSSVDASTTRKAAGAVGRGAQALGESAGLGTTAIAGASLLYEVFDRLGIDETIYGESIARAEEIGAFQEEPIAKATSELFQASKKLAAGDSDPEIGREFMRSLTDLMMAVGPHAAGFGMGGAVTRTFIEAKDFMSARQKRSAYEEVRSLHDRKVEEAKASDNAEAVELARQERENLDEAALADPALRERARDHMVDDANPLEKLDARARKVAEKLFPDEDLETARDVEQRILEETIEDQSDSMSDLTDARMALLELDPDAPRVEEANLMNRIRLLEEWHESGGDPMDRPVIEERPLAELEGLVEVPERVAVEDLYESGPTREDLQGPRLPEPGDERFTGPVRQTGPEAPETSPERVADAAPTQRLRETEEPQRAEAEPREQGGAEPGDAGFVGPVRQLGPDAPAQPRKTSQTGGKRRIRKRTPRKRTADTEKAQKERDFEAGRAYREADTDAARQRVLKDVELGTSLRTPFLPRMEKVSEGSWRAPDGTEIANLTAEEVGTRARFERPQEASADTESATNTQGGAEPTQGDPRAAASASDASVSSPVSEPLPLRRAPPRPPTPEDAGGKSPVKKPKGVPDEKSESGPVEATVDRKGRVVDKKTKRPRTPRKKSKIVPSEGRQRVLDELRTPERYEDMVKTAEAVIGKLGMSGRLDAGEVVGDVWLAAEAKAEQFDPAKGEVGAWIGRIVENKVRDASRKMRKDPQQQESGSGDEIVDALDNLPEPESSLSTADAMDATVRLQLEKQMADLLTPREREVLAERMKGKSNKQIAEEWGVRPDSVRRMFSSAKKKLTGADVEIPDVEAPKGPRGAEPGFVRPGAGGDFLGFLKARLLRQGARDEEMSFLRKGVALTMRDMLVDYAKPTAAGQFNRLVERNVATGTFRHRNLSLAMQRVLEESPAGRWGEALFGKEGILKQIPDQMAQDITALRLGELPLDTFKERHGAKGVKIHSRLSRFYREMADQIIETDPNWLAAKETIEDARAEMAQIRSDYEARKGEGTEKQQKARTRAINFQLQRRQQEINASERVRSEIEARFKRDDYVHDTLSEKAVNEMERELRQKGQGVRLSDLVPGFGEPTFDPQHTKIVAPLMRKRGLLREQGKATDDIRESTTVYFNLMRRVLDVRAMKAATRQYTVDRYRPVGREIELRGRDYIPFIKHRGREGTAQGVVYKMRDGSLKRAQPRLDKKGQPVLNEKGKPIYDEPVDHVEGKKEGEFEEVKGKKLVLLDFRDFLTRSSRREGWMNDGESVRMLVDSKQVELLNPSIAAVSVRKPTAGVQMARFEAMKLFQERGQLTEETIRRIDAKIRSIYESIKEIETSSKSELDPLVQTSPFYQAAREKPVIGTAIKGVEILGAGLREGVMNNILKFGNAAVTTSIGAAGIATSMMNGGHGPARGLGLPALRRISDTLNAFASKGLPATEERLRRALKLPPNDKVHDKRLEGQKLDRLVEQQYILSGAPHSGRYGMGQSLWQKGKYIFKGRGVSLYDEPVEFNKSTFGKFNDFFLSLSEQVSRYNAFDPMFRREYARTGDVKRARDVAHSHTLMTQGSFNIAAKTRLHQKSPTVRAAAGLVNWFIEHSQAQVAMGGLKRYAGFYGFAMGVDALANWVDDTFLGDTYTPLYSLIYNRMADSPIPGMRDLGNFVDTAAEEALGTLGIETNINLPDPISVPITGGPVGTAIVGAGKMLVGGAMSLGTADGEKLAEDGWRDAWRFVELGGAIPLMATAPVVEYGRRLWATTIDKVPESELPTYAKQVSGAVRYYAENIPSFRRLLTAWDNTVLPDGSVRFENAAGEAVLVRPPNAPDVKLARTIAEGMGLEQESVGMVIQALVSNLPNAQWSESQKTYFLQRQASEDRVTPRRIEQYVETFSEVARGVAAKSYALEAKREALRAHLGGEELPKSISRKELQKFEDRVGRAAVTFLERKMPDWVLRGQGQSYEEKVETIGLALERKDHPPSQIKRAVALALVPNEVGDRWEQIVKTEASGDEEAVSRMWDTLFRYAKQKRVHRAESPVPRGMVPEGSWAKIESRVKN